MEKGVFISENRKMELGYYVSLPEDYSEKRQYPMIIFLHGAGERGNGKGELIWITREGICRYLSEGKKYPAIILCPQCPSRLVWNNLVFELKELIDRIALQYHADPHRISITGISMGGYGTWEMGMTYSNFFSALAPVCGGGFSWRCENLKNMPVWAFHGDADLDVPCRNSIEMVDSLNAKGGNARLTIFRGVDHHSWDAAYLETDVIQWLMSQYREDFSVQKEAYDDKI